MTAPRRPSVPKVVSAAVAAALAATVAAGCASSGSTLSASPAEYGSPSARMAIERFLAGVDAEDYQQMGQQFGTRNGPAEKKFGITEVEQRMMVLAGLLQHEDYSLEEADLARTGPHRTRFVADLKGTRDGRVQVPIVAVTTPDGRWFVEKIDVDPLTRQQ